MPEVCVLGLGYVGLPTASVLATAGFQVLGVDVNPKVVEQLNSGKTLLKESGLATLVSAAHKSGNLVAAVKPEASDTFIICVPTPVTPDHGVDLRAVEAAARAIAAVVKPGNLVILESTSPVGTTRNVVGRILREHGLAPGQDVHLCYCPERVLPGNTIAELINNDRIIGGFTRESAEHAQEIYARFSQGNVALTDDLTAEMSKLMENTFRDVNIALANSFARIAEDAGVNVWEAIQLANRHPRVQILSPGPGVGGHCIPVDPWFFVQAFPKHTELLKKAREVNDTQADRMLDRLAATGDLTAGSKLALLGAAYKANIDDPRESPALRMAHAATARGFRVSVHDPHVEPATWEGVPIGSDLGACLKDAAAAVLLTEHTAYRALSGRVFAEAMQGRLILDTRNWLNHSSLRLSGFKVLVLGRPT
ncbi:MAG: UDP-N-acetyl-D-mannosamine dehydrogenase [Planctomycetota bacterium]